MQNAEFLPVQRGHDPIWCAPPEANIRVDLFLIYLVLLGVTLWALWKGLRPRRIPA